MLLGLFAEMHLAFFQFVILKAKGSRFSPISHYRAILGSKKNLIFPQPGGQRRAAATGRLP